MFAVDKAVVDFESKRTQGGGESDICRAESTCFSRFSLSLSLSLCDGSKKRHMRSGVPLMPSTVETYKRDQCRSKLLTCHTTSNQTIRPGREYPCHKTPEMEMTTNCTEASNLLMTWEGIEVGLRGGKRDGRLSCRRRMKKETSKTAR